MKVPLGGLLLAIIRCPVAVEDHITCYVSSKEKNLRASLARLADQWHCHIFIVKSNVLFSDAAGFVAFYPKIYHEDLLCGVLEPLLPRPSNTTIIKMIAGVTQPIGSCEKFTWFEA